MKNPRRRVGYAESLKAFKALEQRVMKGYPDVQLAKKRAAVVGMLLKLADCMAAGLSELASLPVPADRKNTPVKVDLPIATLRGFRAQVVDMLCEGLPAGEPHPELDAARVSLTKAPEPGRELGTACEDLAWYLQWCLFFQLQMEAANVAGLPSEGIDSHVDEAARAEIPMASRNQTLARMKVAIDEDDLGSDDTQLGAVRRAVERRRRHIDTLADVWWGVFQEAATGELRLLLSRCNQDSQEAAEVRAAIEKLRDRKDPQARRMFKQWLTVLLHMETAPP